MIDGVCIRDGCALVTELCISDGVYISDGLCICDNEGVHRMLRRGTPLGRDRSSDKDQPAKAKPEAEECDC